MNKRKPPHNPTTISGLKKLVMAEGRKAWAYYEDARSKHRKTASWFQGYAGAMDWMKHKLKNIQ